ncbi:MAG: ADP-ribosylglycohydrolase family protein [Ignavibacteriales bacterium]|nr:ADP-ribosylglycohydrolase family protein [Ignavibacteriales bacterium]
MKISWLDISDRIKYELRQRLEEGNNVSELVSDFENLQKSINGNDTIQLEKFYQRVESIPSRVLNEKNEPSEWDDIVRMSNIQDDTVPVLSKSVIEDKILGGWLGRSAGCLLGKPVEKIDRSGMIELLSSNRTWPISDYISGIGIPEPLLQKYPWNKHSGKESLKENIVCMAEDDDMNYPMMNLVAFELFGEKFTTENILQTWMDLAPVLSIFTAERVAYANALAGILPPLTATVRNPYREWIGAQIRADVWGWISPSQPARAAEFAWRDARLSHVRNGIYGEMFFAAGIAASFKHSSIPNIINEALQFIPPQSRFAEAIRFVLTLPIPQQSWDSTVDDLYKKFGRYHWVHAINNAALIVAALISSQDDYERAICNVVMGGWDTDSNGATVGSIMGTMLGAQQLPKKWTSPLNNKIRSSLKGFDNAPLSDLAQRTVKIAQYTS